MVFAHDERQFKIDPFKQKSKFNSRKNDAAIEFYLRIQWRLIFGNLMRCFAIRLWVGSFIYFKFTPVFF